MPSAILIQRDTCMCRCTHFRPACAAGCATVPPFPGSSTTRLRRRLWSCCCRRCFHPHSFDRYLNWPCCRQFLHPCRSEKRSRSRFRRFPRSRSCFPRCRSTYQGWCCSFPDWLRSGCRSARYPTDPKPECPPGLTDWSNSGCSGCCRSGCCFARFALPCRQNRRSDCFGCWDPAAPSSRRRKIPKLPLVS